MNKEPVHYLVFEAEKEKREKFEKALNQIGMLAMGEFAYTKEFTEQVEDICREALSVPKKWPY